MTIETAMKKWQTFLETALPKQGTEDWKYADFSFLKNSHFTLSKKNSYELETILKFIEKNRLQKIDSILLVFIDGYFIPHLSELNKLPASSSYQTNKPNNDVLPNQPFKNINAAMHTDGIVITLPDHCELSLPLHCLFIASDQANFMAHTNNKINLGKASKLCLMEETISMSSQAYLMNTVTTMAVNEDAKLEYYKIQNENNKAAHIAHTLIEQQASSHVDFMNFSFGCQFGRDDLTILLQGQSAHGRAAGFYYLTHPDQYIDHHIVMEHTAPLSQSEMTYKGIIDKNACAVFNGRVHVFEAAKKIQANQANHHLLLSNQAQAFSKPELEIYADDVKCKHGAATGQLDEEALFYLCSRGIPKSEAIDILLSGFYGEIIERINHAAIKQHVQSRLPL